MRISITSDYSRLQEEKQVTEREFLQIMSVLAKKIESLEMLSDHLLESNAKLEEENKRLTAQIDGYLAEIDNAEVEA